MNRHAIFAAAVALFAFSACDNVQPTMLEPTRSADYAAAINSVEIAEAQQQIGNSTFVVIGPEGGRLTNGAHVLTVPAGSVNVPTLFLINSVPGNRIKVRLYAYVGSNFNTEIHTFAGPLRLSLSYQGVKNVTDPSRLFIMCLVDGTDTGRLEVLPSTVDASQQKVSATIYHFSDYATGQNRTEPPPPVEP